MANLLQVQLFASPTAPASISWQGEALDISKQKAIACLFYLAANENAISRDEIAEVLWGVGRFQNLRQLLHFIRRLPGADLWFKDGDPLSLQRECDVLRFSQACAEQNYAVALELYQGSFLKGFRVRNAPSFQDWQELEQSRLQSLYMECLSTHAHNLELQNESQEALKHLHKLIDLDPLIEDAHRRVMVLEWRAGNIKAALEQFESCRRVLAQELGLEPVSSTLQLFEKIQSQTDKSINIPQNPDSQKTASHNFKEETTTESTSDFVGRNEELQLLDEHFLQHRLVSIIGPGGMGKTSLAKEFTQHSKLAQQKHTVFISLSALRNTKFIVAAIANSLNINFKGPLDPINQLVTSLKHQEILLVLDNLEQLLDADDIIKTLLEGTTHLQILATSRRVLGLEQEQTLFLQGLAYPSTDNDTATTTDAVRFFVKSAHDIDSSFALTSDNQEAVFQICRLLQGLPLGLELAAGWLRFYDCEGLAKLLEEDALELENPGLDLEERHTSLRYIMEHSWAYLSEDQKSILSSLAICRGGFTLQAARAVAGADISMLSSLIEQSLLQLDSQKRYNRHPLVYEFSYEKLRISSFETQVSVHHARYYLQLLCEQTEHILGTSPKAALDLIEEDFENIRIAWMYATNANWHETLLEASEALSLYADMRVRFHEAIELFDETVAVLKQHEGSEVTSALILADKGSHLNRLNRHSEALAIVNEALETIDSTNIAALDRLLRLKATCSYGLADYPQAKALFEEILSFSKKHYPEQLSRDHRALANIEVCLGHYDSAEKNYRTAIELDKKNGYVVGLAINLNNLSELLILNHNYNEASAMIEKSLSYVEGVDIHLVPYLNLNKAQLAFQADDLTKAKSFAELSYQDAKSYAQINLQSRSKSLLAHIAYLNQDETSAKEHIQEAIHIAAENNATASLMIAFIVQSKLVKDETIARQYLNAVIENGASEYSDIQTAKKLLDTSNASSEQTSKQQAITIPELLKHALPEDSFIYHKDTLILDQ